MKLYDTVRQTTDDDSAVPGQIIAIEGQWVTVNLADDNLLCCHASQLELIPAEFVYMSDEEIDFVLWEEQGKL